jgi:hypothetical protein
MRSTSIILSVAVFCFVVLLAIGTATAGGKWKVNGTFVEGCSCSPPCTCELLEQVEMGCQGVGTISISSGSYNGVDLSGVKIVYATTPGKWVRLYVDSKNDKQRESATEFAKAYYKDFGPMESVSAASIELTGDNGKYSVKVDGGKIMSLETEPMLGGDGKTAVTYSNTHSKLNPTVMQGKTISGTFSDGERKFELKGTNSYFNTHMKSSGSL